MKTTIGRRGALAQTALALAGIYGFIGCGPEAAGQAPAASAEVALVGSALSAAGPFTHYVVMGDSFSAGTGLVDQAGACTSSMGGWPFQVAPVVNELTGAPPSAAPPEILFKACSGAKTENITGPYPQRMQLAQIDATLSTLPSTTLITFTIGGNDAGVTELDSCFNALLENPMTADAPCRQLASAIINRIDTVVAPKLQSTFAALKAAAPAGSTIVAVGYPHMLSTANNTYCTAAGFNTSVSSDLRNLFNQGVDRLNAAITDAAKDAEILSITDEVVENFRGHELCSEQEFFVFLGDPLMITEAGTISEATGHPNEAGYEAYATAIRQGLSTRVRINNTVETPELPVAGSAAPPTIPTTPEPEPEGEEEPWEEEPGEEGPWEEEPWGEEGEEEYP